jgi:hypothetical protein
MIYITQSKIPSCKVSQTHWMRKPIKFAFWEKIPYIRGIGDEFTQEDVFAAIKRVDNDVHQPRTSAWNVNFSL